MLQSALLSFLWIFFGDPPESLKTDLSYANIDRAAAVMRYPGAENTKILWAHCPFGANAYYDHQGDQILLCYELIPILKTINGETWPFALRGILAHEMAHSVIQHQNIPTTGSAEAAADELAAITLNAAGMHTEVIELARVYVAFPEGEGDLADDHPSGKDRAKAMACMAVGALGGGDCTYNYRRAWYNWGRLLKTWDERGNIVPPLPMTP